MAIIYHRTEEFPVCFNRSGIWYILIKGGKKPTITDYSSSKTNTRRLLNYLKTEFDEETDILLGSWTGTWRTDLFVLEKNIIIERFQEELDNK